MNISATPLPVKRTLRRLGAELRDARKRRRIPMRLAAERAGISRATLGKIENGDEGVSLGAFAKILFVLGMIQRLDELADSRFDSLGLELEAQHLPQRIRISKKEKEG
jgi:transcriptional regulator with XRE-family HTH domain